ncbi:MAG: GxxExxY protein [Candidatus Thiodiazotropha sp. (ex Dulcina madagascariensis)]|nr:GxxExxY protein [Candidatus Thiodiazotropha sp. (ex Dulcina madagascariensis)]
MPETVYEAILAHPLRQRGFPVERQAADPIKYLGLRFGGDFRANLVVEEKSESTGLFQLPHFGYFLWRI